MNNRASVTTSRPCPISNSNVAWVVCDHDRHGKKLRNVLSANSGLIFVDPVPFENTEEFYKSEYRKSYKGVHQPKPKHVYRAGKIALQRYSRLSGLLPPSANCLDAGSSSGEFVYLLKSRNHDAQGVEANIPYAEYSQSELKIRVSISPFSEFKTEERFDLITMFHVLEHLEYPIRDLSHFGNLLKPGGYFVIEVPNILYPDMAFSHKWHPGHLFSFSAQTLSLLMQKAGFKTISCSPIGDGGNLWGVFQFDHSSSPENLSLSISFATVLDELFKCRILYHLHFWNYLKFFPKLLRQIIEKISSGGKSGREILTQIYS
jgi:2-polyprenyl-3-methyl-5-hydroxy-6-metoxy-1,4-benzoquinol methylase